MKEIIDTLWDWHAFVEGVVIWWFLITIASTFSGAFKIKVMVVDRNESRQLKSE